jgi:hypothetical protein
MSLRCVRHWSDCTFNGVPDLAFVAYVSRLWTPNPTQMTAYIESRPIHLCMIRRYNFPRIHARCVNDICEGYLDKPDVEAAHDLNFCLHTTRCANHVELVIPCRATPRQKAADIKA